MTTVRQLLDQKGRNIWSIHPDATVFDAKHFRDHPALRTSRSKRSPLPSHARGPKWAPFEVTRMRHRVSEVNDLLRSCPAYKLPELKAAGNWSERQPNAGDFEPFSAFDSDP